MSCECKLAGYCKRYDRLMSLRGIEICQGINITPEKAERYRQNWLSLKGVTTSIPKTVGDFAVSVFRYTASGFENRSKAEYQRCLNTCSNCEHLSQSTKQCGVCNCFVVLKAAMKTEDCPLGKW